VTFVTIGKFLPHNELANNPFYQSLGCCAIKLLELYLIFLIT
jgi:hypothetical protein